MNFDWHSGCTVPGLLMAKEIQNRSRRGPMSVLYRENCGGVLRNLACGMRKQVQNLAELDLYDDLRERIFKNRRADSDPKTTTSS